MLRLGLIDFDSSHCVEFTRRINHVGVPADQWVEGARVVAGWPGSSQMAPERIDGFRPQVEACGVELVGEASELLEQVDAVLVLSLSGTPHLERARPFLEAGVPTYVDKPMACSLSDAREMFSLAARQDLPFFSTSAIRYCGELVDFAERRPGQYGAVHGAVSYGPAWRADGNPGLFHYGIHPVEVLVTLLGPGCRSVSIDHTDAADVVTVRWRDGRVGVIRGGREGATAYGFIAWCEHAVIHRDVSTRFSYRNLCHHIVQTLSGNTPPPVAPSETLEVIALIEAALESEANNGQETELKS